MNDPKESRLFTRRDGDEALDHLNDLFRELDIEPAACDVSVIIPIYHVLDHLCLAWHRRAMPISEIMDQSFDEFESLTYQIPNWEGRFTLVEMPLVLRTSSNTTITFDSEFDCASLVGEIGPAQKSLQEVCRSDYAWTTVDEFDRTLEHSLAELLSGICRGWHLSHVRASDRPSLSSTDLAEVSNSVPIWDARYRIVRAYG